MTRKEAIETIRMCCPRVGDSQCSFESALRELVPELRESEDERIMNNIIVSVKMNGGLTQARKSEIYAYLEKQKEQSLRDYIDDFPYSDEQKEQKPAEWSEEDEKMLAAISKALGCDTAEKTLVNEGVTLVMAAGFLESLPLRCPKSSDNWKPSEEQMDALLWCTAHLGGADHRVLAELYEHLKKLM